MEHLNSNVVDLTVIGILALSGLLAFIRGLVREMVILGVWVGSVIASAMFYPVVKPWMTHYIKNEMGADAASALALFCASLIVLIPVGHLISSFVKGETLTAIDRSLGFVFGVVRGVLVVCLLYLGASWIWPELDHQPEWLKVAKTRPAMIWGADIIKSLVPKSELDKAKKDLDTTKASVEQAQDHIDALNKLTTTVPAAKPQQAPSYSDDTRGNLEKLINEKGK
jgi:membrane protein required for colicin V production